MEPDNVRALETSGALLIDLGNLDAAKQVGQKIKMCVNYCRNVPVFSCQPERVL